MAPIARGKKGQFVKELESAKKDGYVRVRVDGIIYDLSEKIELDKNKKHNIEIVVDRLVKKRAFEAGLPIPLKQQQVFQTAFCLLM